MEIVIKTDGTVEGTSLTVDGKVETTESKITSINMYAIAPYTSSYSGQRMPGSVSCSYEYANGGGVIERRSICSCESECDEGIGSSEMEEEDSVKNSKTIGKASTAIRYIGQQVDVETATVVDKILDHCQKNNLKSPAKEVLLARSLVSLKDKAEDLGVVLEDSTPVKPEEGAK